eukprot:jgi/Ulvmu1/4091/UM019_0070.1
MGRTHPQPATRYHRACRGTGPHGQARCTAASVEMQPRDTSRRLSPEDDSAKMQPLGRGTSREGQGPRRQTVQQCIREDGAYTCLCRDTGEACVENPRCQTEAAQAEAQGPRLRSHMWHSNLATVLVVSR